LETIDITGKVVTADALLTQRQLARYLVKRQAHYHFTVKGNQPSLLEDLQLFFKERAAPDFTEVAPADHGRIEDRKIWTTTELNLYLDFAHVGQAFVIERHFTHKKSGKHTQDVAYGITSHDAAAAGEQHEPAQHGARREHGGAGRPAPAAISERHRQRRGVGAHQLMDFAAVPAQQRRGEGQ